MQSDREMVAQNFLVEYVEPDGMDMLEVGCGDGTVTALVADWAQSYVAIDTDPDKLVEAEVRVPGVAFLQGDGEALDFPDESFDVVLFTLSLHHMQADVALLEARRVLRPGGRVVVLEPVPFSEKGRVCAVFRDEAVDHAQAQQAIADGPLSVVRRDLFRTELVYDDAQEFMDTLYAHFEEDEDDDLTHLALSELDEKRYDEPLTVFDDLLIILLERTE